MNDHDRLTTLIYNIPSKSGRRVTMPVAVEIATHLLAAGVSLTSPKCHCGHVHHFDDRCGESVQHVDFRNVTSYHQCLCESPPMKSFRWCPKCYGYHNQPHEGECR